MAISSTVGQLMVNADGSWKTPWSILTWVVPRPAATGRKIFTIYDDAGTPNQVIYVNSHATDLGVITCGADHFLNSNVTLPQTLTSNYPILIGISCVAGGVQMFVTDATGTASSGWTRARSEPPAGQYPSKVTLGAGISAADGMIGGNGLYCIRNHIINAADMAAIWATGNAAAPLYLVAGNMTGIDGVLWATGGMMTRPGFKNDQAGTTDEPPAPGKEVIERAMVYDSGGPHHATCTGLLRWFVARDVTVARGTREGPFWDSPFDPPWSSMDFFTRTAITGDDAIATVTHTPDAIAEFPISKELAMNRPRGARRVTICGNSRACFEGPEPYGNAPNWCGGLARQLGNRVIGTDCFQLPPYAALGTVGLGRFAAGYKWDDQMKLSAAAGSVVVSADSNSTCRFSLGHRNGGVQGQGSAREIQQSQTLRLLFDEQGGFLRTDPIRCAIHILKYPGGGSYKIRSVRDSAQSQTADETIVAAYGDAISTATAATLTHAYVTGDGAYTPSGGDGNASLVLDGTGLAISVGQVCVLNPAGAAGTDMAVVTNISEAAGQTTLTLEHDFTGTPVKDTDTFAFGAWDLATITVDHAALDATDTVKWRGWEMEVQAGTRGVMVLGVGAWSTGKWGWIVVNSGAGSGLYSRFLDKTNEIGPNGTTDGPLARWLGEIENADVAVLANTATEVSRIGDWIAALSAANPDAEIIMFGSGGYGFPLLADHAAAKSANETWIATADTYDIPGVTIYNTTGIGWDRWLAGDYYDGTAHQSSRGMGEGIANFLSLLATAMADAAEPQDIDYPLSRDLRAGKYARQGRTKGTMPQAMVSV